MIPTGLLVRLLIGLIGLVGVTGGGAIIYIKGKEAGRAECKAAQAQGKISQGVQKKRDQDAVKGLQESRKEREVVYETIVKEVEKVVERPVYIECRMDDDGLRLWNGANAGVLLPSAPGANGGVPGTPPTGRPNDAGNAPQPR